MENLNWEHDDYPMDWGYTIFRQTQINTSSCCIRFIFQPCTGSYACVHIIVSLYLNQLKVSVNTTESISICHTILTKYALISIKPFTIIFHTAEKGNYHKTIFTHHMANQPDTLQNMTTSWLVSVDNPIPKDYFGLVKLPI